MSLANGGKTCEAGAGVGVLQRCGPDFWTQSGYHDGQVPRRQRERIALEAELGPGCGEGRSHSIKVPSMRSDEDVLRFVPAMDPATFSGGLSNVNHDLARSL